MKAGSDTLVPIRFHFFTSTEVNPLAHCNEFQAVSKNFLQLVCCSACDMSGCKQSPQV